MDKKRLLSLLLAAGLCVSLTACGGTTPEDDPDEGRGDLITEEDADPTGYTAEELGQDDFTPATLAEVSGTWVDDYGAVLQINADAESYLYRTDEGRVKTGVFTGFFGINPVNGAKVPVFVADYVLMGYGTGAIMAVPAHDERDWDFAKKFGLPIVEVVSGGEDVQKAAFTAKDDTGILVNSDFLNGLTVKDAIPVITKWLEDKLSLIHI